MFLQTWAYLTINSVGVIRHRDPDVFRSQGESEIEGGWLFYRRRRCVDGADEGWSRKFTSQLSPSRTPFPILESWESSENVEERCGWWRVGAIPSHSPFDMNTMNGHSQTRPTESWDSASTDLFESFRQYDESGSPRRIQVLKYLVLTYILMGSEINPFDSQETKPYVPAFSDWETCSKRDDGTGTRTIQRLRLWLASSRRIKDVTFKKRNESWKVSHR